MEREPLDREALLQSLVAPAGPIAWIRLVESTASTNAELAAAVRNDPNLEAPGVLVAEHQSAGRGRAGRSWDTPPRAAITLSVLLRPQVPPSALGWVPLLAGVATARTVAAAGTQARLKWPNDVLVPASSPVAGLGAYRKVAGILAEVVADAVVVGIGLNVSQQHAELPVPTATSLALEGAGTDRTALLTQLVRELTDAVARFEDAGGDAVASGLAQEYADLSATLGTAVRAQLAGGTDVVEGAAVRLDDAGALVVATPEGERVVTAGDVHHLRVRG